MSDASVANIARDLADALMARARTRSNEDQKRVLELQTALCAEIRDEQREQADAEHERLI